MTTFDHRPLVAEAQQNAVWLVIKREDAVAWGAHTDAQAARIKELEEALLEERARNQAARMRLGNLKAIHSQWYDGKIAASDASREMESIACSALMYLAGVNGPLLHDARAALEPRS